MHTVDPAWVEHQRKRWMRPGAERYWRGDVARYYRPLHPDEIKNGAQPRYPGERIDGGHDDQPRQKSWTQSVEDAAANEIEAIWHEHLYLKWMLADLKLDLLRREFARKAFNPSQPRVPAGNPDGGQWTSGDGGGSGSAQRTRPADAGGRNDPRVLSDATPDNPWKPGAQYAQGSQSGYPVDLRDEEARGGHTIQAHVNRSREALIAEAQAAFDRNPNARDSRSGSFPSLEAANKLVNSTLAQNQAAVEQVANGLGTARLSSRHLIPRREPKPSFRTGETRPIFKTHIG